MIARKARFRRAKYLQNIVGYRVPESVFTGPFLEAVTSCMNYRRMDKRLKEQLLNIFRDFLDCNCKGSPLCGCPEKKFAKTIIELRMTGLDHHQIGDVLQDEYGIDLYPADILGFLEESVHVLEAIKSVAEIEKKTELASLSAECISGIEQ
ncbi:DUF5814 domain-containing protein [Methanoplanus limicola]|jgi:superfamily II helicase|uniref:Superfamily II helicase-like protein n=1 Tax=Methanoplanus limicola DSM 2279 TaxID=937775 RepID=H1Z287_9EURY|nr:DUF5814 domain-containing protein [Methanoplanus limicola]EHQ34616.1 superfamily II helicase-like protein [Methanoplanus limicola DSM 2279]